MASRQLKIWIKRCHLFSNVLDDCDTSSIEHLLLKSFHALPRQGMVVIHDAHINRHKTGPLQVANYSVFLMTSNEGKCYSIAEVESLLNKTGFRDVAYCDTILGHSVIKAFK